VTTVCLWRHPSPKYRAVAGDYEGAVAADFSRQLLALRARFRVMQRLVLDAQNITL
jgi:hypothetical protein